MSEAGERPRVVMERDVDFDRAAAAWMEEQARAAIARQGRFDVAVSGGRAPLGAYERLAAAIHSGAIDFRDAHVWQADERAVPPEAEERNARAIRERLLDPAGIPADHWHPMAAERADLESAARDYQAALPAALDLVVLGLGEDGHTASLFPGSVWLAERERLVGAVTDSPKPPPRRLTVTPVALSNARALLVLVRGLGKHQALRDIVEGADPARRPAALAWRHPNACWFVEESLARAAGLERLG